MHEQYFENSEFERLYEVMAEAKEAIQLAKTALRKKTLDERQLNESFDEVPEASSGIVHILPKTIVDFNHLQSKKLSLVPDITDLLAKLSEDLCLVVVLNRTNLNNKAVRKHIDEILTVTIMVAKVLSEEIGRKTSGLNSPDDPGPSVA